MQLERIWLLEIESLDELNNPETLRFSSGDYTDESGNYYDLRVKQPALFTTSAFTGEVIRNGSRSAFGEAVLTNIDGGLDYLADYAVDGRQCLVKLIDEFGVITTVVDGTVESLSFDQKSVSVRLRDPQAQLELEHPQVDYLGNNILPDGLEGTADDLKGQPKPIVYGKVRNAEPFLVNTTRYIYQVHDQSVDPLIDVEVLAVYDRGVLLVKDAHYTDLASFLAATVPSGGYATYEGYFRLHAAPVGQITCDVDSDVTLLGDVFELIATEAGYTVDPLSVTAFNLFGDVGIYLSSRRTTSSMFDLLAQSVGGYWYFKQDNSIALKLLEAPVTPDIFVEDFEVVSITRDSTGSGSNGLPVYRVLLQADKIETVQTDVAAGADDVIRARVSVQFREAIAEDLAVKTRHPLSEEFEVETALRDLTQAQTAAERIQTLLGVRRDSTKATVRLDATIASQLELGKVVNLSTYKFGYSAGRNFVLLGYTLDARLSRAELELWG